MSRTDSIRKAREMLDCQTHKLWYPDECLSEKENMEWWGRLGHPMPGNLEAAAMIVNSTEPPTKDST